MHAKERYYATRDDNRIVYPFAWGTEFVNENANGGNPREFFLNNTRDILADSDSYFFKPEIADYKLTGEDLTWTSAIKTPSTENNTVRAKFFPAIKNDKLSRSAVIVLPHWNAPRESYVALCKVLNKVGLSALRVTLPYHEDRMPPELERADWIVNPNIGRTLQSVRQGVIDTRAAINWLKNQGFEKIGIVGTSIGSATAFLTMVHDERIDASVFNHVSGYFSDVVWHGISTLHVKEGLQDNVSLEELREFWMPVSPMAYMKKLASQSPRSLRFIYALYDLTFPIDFSRETLRALRTHKIKFSKAAIPCGHYTLGEPPWVYIDGWKIVSFLKRKI